MRIDPSSLPATRVDPELLRQINVAAAGLPCPPCEVSLIVHPEIHEELKREELLRAIAIEYQVPLRYLYGAVEMSQADVHQIKGFNLALKRGQMDMLLRSLLLHVASQERELRLREAKHRVHAPNVFDLEDDRAIAREMRKVRNYLRYTRRYRRHLVQ